MQLTILSTQQSAKSSYQLDFAHFQPVNSTYHFRHKPGVKSSVSQPSKPYALCSEMPCFQAFSVLTSVLLTSTLRTPHEYQIRTYPHKIKEIWAIFYNTKTVRASLFPQNYECTQFSPPDII